MKESGVVLISIGIWGMLSLIICIPICKYIVYNTDNEELAHLVFPVWIILSIISVGLYLL